MAEALPFRLPPPAQGGVDLLVIAGEHSGDQHGASMVRALRANHPDLRVAALGGTELAGAGAQLLHDLTASSVVGLVEVLKNYSFFKMLFEEILRWIAEHRPRVVCFVDYPGLNLRLAAALHERGLSVKGGGKIRLAYYISPQIWAWKAGRRFTMAKHLDAMAVIFPFEVQSYADTDLPVEFVGHPFVADGYAAPVHFDPAGPLLLLPGSRRQAVARIFPVLLAGHAAQGKRPAIVLYPSEDILAVLRAANPPAGIEFRRTGEPVGASAVLTSSGTMSMHCALAAIPGAIAYRANPLTYLIGRMLLKVPYLGIANLLLKEPMYPEYIQGAATPEALAREVQDCLENPARLARTREQAKRLHDGLRRPATGTAADWLGRQLEQARV
ncbi:MAG TPA: lipid-A-disaccharide synthase [Opitutaceae bacterium]